MRRVMDRVYERYRQQMGSGAGLWNRASEPNVGLHRDLSGEEGEGVGQGGGGGEEAALRVGGASRGSYGGLGTSYEPEYELSRFSGLTHRYRESGDGHSPGGLSPSGLSGLSPSALSPCGLSPSGLSNSSEGGSGGGGGGGGGSGNRVSFSFGSGVGGGDEAGNSRRSSAESRGSKSPPPPNYASSFSEKFNLKSKGNFEAGCHLFLTKEGVS